MLTYLARSAAVLVAVAVAAGQGSLVEVVYRRNYRLAEGSLHCYHIPNSAPRWASHRRYVVEEVQRRIGSLDAVAVAVVQPFGVRPKGLGVGSFVVGYVAVENLTVFEASATSLLVVSAMRVHPEM